ncbi:hypothetical protein CBR_g29696 [Chara braunii]|uniref:Queuine tRNA-ribosyltransferase accessory subunit 2 n=1 Tax=Chara braunii TaxID=69332 RepID=A0A388LB61_CHABU|nr:hypothetical protein CBR_g29696 [Chara braunii]|eukprot:GBG79549.1 hypothetical protein CBR_g29696 [Chara braunii]
MTVLQFAVQTTVGAARHGLLSLPQRGVEIATPAVVLYTRRGLPVHLTADLLRTLGPDARSLQVNPVHFLESPGPDIVQVAGSIHDLLSFHDYALFALTSDPLEFEAGGTTTKTSASFETPAGRRSVTISQYMEVINAMKPDVAASLTDEILATSSAKRTIKSVDRSLRWLDSCLDLRATGSLDLPIFGSIQGGGMIAERERSACETAKREVAGFHLGGFGRGETYEERSLLLQAAINHLPPEKPRHISGLGVPEDVLQGISAGVDLFDGSYAHRLTMGGFAMVFPPDEEEDDVAFRNGVHVALGSAVAAQNGQAKGNGVIGGMANGGGGGGRNESAQRYAAEVGEADADGATLVELKSHRGRERGRDGKKDKVGKGELPEEHGGVVSGAINLRSTAYRLDGRPILAGCECFSCRNHSRAYIHHLLNTSEMLAQVLLDIHNIHHYLRFFRATRRAISEMRFSEYCNWFLKRRLDCSNGRPASQKRFVMEECHSRQKYSEKASLLPLSVGTF